VRRLASLSAIATLLAFSLVGCQALASTPPPPTPADFAGIVAFLASEGIGVQDVRTGDAGCDDRQLIGPAISLRASGLDQAAPATLHFYLFKGAPAYEKLRSAVDACAASFVTDASTYESIDAMPFVAAGQGPWAPGFSEALRTALTKAAGG
jgi:hypothetical protein